MTGWGAVEHAAIRGLRGPLLVVGEVGGVGWDEYVTVRTEGGPDRHGVVLEVDRDLAVVQVLEGTEGLDPRRTRVRFAGRPAARAGRRGLAGPGVQRPGGPVGRRTRRSWAPSTRRRRVPR